MTEQKIYKPRPITGFPEWLPEIRRIEQQWMDHIRKVFESYGFCSIETPSVEELDVLRAKGEVDKEIYVIERLHKDEKENHQRQFKTVDKKENYQKQFKTVDEIKKEFISSSFFKKMNEKFQISENDIKILK
jgi:guanylate kinase